MLVQFGTDLQFQDVAHPRGGTWTLVDFDDWYETAEPAVDVVKNPLGVGAFEPPESTWQQKYMDLVADVWVPPGNDVRTYEWRRWSALGRKPFTVTVTDSFGILTSQVRLAEKIEFQMGLLPWYARVTFHLLAVDPLKYGPTRNVRIPASRPVTDGLRFPLFESGRLDFGVWAAAGLSGKFTFFNGGTEESWPWFQADGSLAGGFQIISGPDTIEFAADVPMNTQLVLSPYAGGRAVLDGVDVTTNLLSPAWAPLQPGERREFTFLPNGAVSGGAGLTAFFREAHA